MGMPMIIGAGVGALSSAAMGKSPLTGALLGGVTGGAFGGAGGFGSGFTDGGLLSSIGSSTTGAGVKLAPTIANVADDVALNSLDDIALNQSLNTALPTNVAGGGGASINFKDFYPTANFADDSLSFGQPLSSSNQMFTNNLSSQFSATPNPLTIDPRRMVVDTPLTFGERLSDMGSSLFSYGKDNPMTLLGGANTLSGISAQNRQAQQQRLNQAVATGAQPIRRPQFDPSSTIAAAPSYGLSQEEIARGKLGQIASQARLNDEDKLRQFYTSLIG